MSEYMRINPLLDACPVRYYSDLFPHLCMGEWFAVSIHKYQSIPFRFSGIS